MSSLHLYAMISSVRPAPPLCVQARSKRLVAKVVEMIMMGIMYDIQTKHENLEPIFYLLTSHEPLARMIASSNSWFRTRPVVRCQQCNLCAEELRVPSKSFKRCSRCSDELHCGVYYCSQYVRQLQAASSAYVSAHALPQPMPEGRLAHAQAE